MRLSVFAAVRHPKPFAYDQNMAPKRQLEHCPKLCGLCLPEIAAYLCEYPLETASDCIRERNSVSRRIA